MIIIETSRLIIRQFESQDIEAIFKLNSIPEVLTYIPGAAMTKLAQAEQILNDVILNSYAQRGYGRWAVEHKADGEVIGFCGPKYVEEFGEIELGYRYLPQYWRQGFAVEAGTAVLSVFDQYEINEVIALILNGNKGSEAVATKLGMQQRGKDKFMGHIVNVFHKQL
ncbi:GNAT family N-acetyltransferase [Shewanella sp.]|nr:GNAT family N-acetyltransferase [Shewanella sp.]